MSTPYEAPQVQEFENTPKQGFFGHPWGLLLLFIVEMWERFSYYGMRAMLVLYLISASSGPKLADEGAGRGWDKADASILYGWYTGMAYFLPLFGGIIADRLIGTHRSMVLGGILIAMGHVALAVSGFGSYETSTVGMSIFIFGLVMIIFGTGHFKPCVTAMCGQLYDLKDPRRDGAFTIFYMGVNTGAFIGPLVCGYLAYRYGWHYGFGAAAIGMIAGLIIYLIWRPKYLGHVGEPRVNRGWTMTAIWIPVAIAFSAAVALMFHYGVVADIRGGFQSFAASYPSLDKIVKIGVLVAVVAAAIFFVSIQTPEYRKPVTSIFIFMIFNAFFWCAFEQAGSSMNIFAEENTNRRLLASSENEFPASWFQSVNPFAIVTLGPIVAALWTYLGRRKMNPSQPVKIGYALLFMALAYVVMVFAGRNAFLDKTKVHYVYLTAAYVIMTVGELCISPTGLSYITKAAPTQYMSLLIGFYYISNSVAQIIGGFLAASVEKIEKGEIKLPWDVGGQGNFFMLFVISSAGAAIVAFALSPLLKKLMPKNLQ